MFESSVFSSLIGYQTFELRCDWAEWASNDTVLFGLRSASFSLFGHDVQVMQCTKEYTTLCYPVDLGLVRGVIGLGSTW